MTAGHETAGQLKKFLTMKNGSNIKTSGAGNFVRGALQHVIYFVLPGLLAVFSQTAFADDANDLFLKTCASCHGRDGKAQTPAAKKLGVKDLSQSTLTDAQIVQQITEGKQAGQDSSKMPAFNEKLTPEEIQSLVPVVKTFRK